MQGRAGIKACRKLRENQNLKQTDPEKHTFVLRERKMIKLRDPGPLRVEVNKTA